MRGGNARAIQLHSLFPDLHCTGKWAAGGVGPKGIETEVYFKTHLLKAPREFLLPNYLSISQSLLNLLSQCLCETKWLRYFTQHLGALILEQKLMSCIRGGDKPFWMGFPTFGSTMWGAAEAALWEPMRKADLFVENNGGCLNTGSQESS